MLRIAIVGRPNVGKSTLFNRLCGRRKAIVGDEPGITRDCNYAVAQWRGKAIEIMDTGGMIPKERGVIPAKVLAQAAKAIKESDHILLVVDGRTGSTASDEQLLPILRNSGRSFSVVVNKIDTPEMEIYTTPFYAYGSERLFAISAEHGRGIGDLLDAMAELAGEESARPREEAFEEIAVAVVGRPNVGKSSLVNRLLGFERSIVAEMPGTTRDSVDTLLLRDGICYRIIDTAGIRRKGRTAEHTEKISVVMARKNLQRADVALLVLDAREGVTKLDASIGGYAAESGRSVVIVLNKWDLVPKKHNTQVEFRDLVRRRMKYLNYGPIVSISALTGQRVSRLFGMIRQAYEARRIQVPTGMLNNLFARDLERRWSTSHTSQKLNIRYMTQVRSDPPTFAVFLGGLRTLHFSTERFLINELRKRFGFYATPIRIQQRLKKRRAAR